MSPQYVYVCQVWMRFVDGKEALRLVGVTQLRSSCAEYRSPIANPCSPPDGAGRC
jgi:hypothetical protein